MKNLYSLVLILAMLILSGYALSASALNKSDFAAIWLMDEGSGNKDCRLLRSGNTGTIAGAPNGWLVYMDAR